MKEKKQNKQEKERPAPIPEKKQSIAQIKEQQKQKNEKKAAKNGNNEINNNSSTPKLCLELFPRTEYEMKELTAQKFNPFLKLFFKKSKPVSFVIKHISDKWQSVIPQKQVKSIRLYPKMENFLFATHRGWGSTNTDTMENIYEFLGKGEKFQLFYTWQDASLPNVAVTSPTVSPTTTKINQQISNQNIARTAPAITGNQIPTNLNNLNPNNLNAINMSPSTAAATAAVLINSLLSNQMNQQMLDFNTTRLLFPAPQTTTTTTITPNIGATKVSSGINQASASNIENVSINANTSNVEQMSVSANPNSNPSQSSGQSIPNNGLIEAGMEAAPNAFDSNDPFAFNTESFFANSQNNKIADDENSNRPLLFNSQSNPPLIQTSAQPPSSVSPAPGLTSPPRPAAIQKEDQTPFFSKHSATIPSTNSFASPLTGTPPSKPSVDFETFSPLFSTPKIDLGRKPGFMSPPSSNKSNNSLNSGNIFNNLLFPTSSSSDNKENTPNNAPSLLLQLSNEKSNDEDFLSPNNDSSIFPAKFPTPNNNSMNGNDQTVSLSQWCKQAADSQDSFTISKGFLS